MFKSSLKALWKLSESLTVKFWKINAVFLIDWSSKQKKTNIPLTTSFIYTAFIASFIRCHIRSLWQTIILYGNLHPLKKNHFIAGSARMQKTIKMFTFVSDLECNCNNKTRQKKYFSLLWGSEKSTFPMPDKIESRHKLFSRKLMVVWERKSLSSQNA